MTPHPIPARLMALTGWRRRGALFGLGAAAALALPPVHLVPVLLACLPALAWILDGSPNRKAAFGAGFWFGLGWFAAGTYWISHALLTDPARFGWMIPFAVFGLSGLLAAFLGLATLAARALVPWGPGRIPALAAAWTVSDWLRSWVLTGFPWNPLGSVWDAWGAPLQFGAIAGVWGLTLLTALAALAPVAWVERHRRLAAAFAAPLALACVWGMARLTAPTELVPEVRLRLVQANVNQANKWRDDLREANLQRHIALSEQPGREGLTAVIWPETAASYFLDLDAAHRERVAAVAPPGGLVITGAPRITPRGVEPLQIWNSLMAFDGQGGLAGLYDKVHLVPFGEYVPLRAILPIAKLTHGGTDFSAGPGPRTLALPGLPPASPIICYEAIFPGAVVGRDQPRPGWLLNVTNDGWFGLSAGPHQHLAAARLRAVEEGLPLVRAANTGISAVTDAYGRVIASLPLGEGGVLDSSLPRSIDQTVYARLGDIVPALLVAVCIGIGVALRRLKYSAK